MVKNCRICKFWKKYPYKLSEKHFFEAKVREGCSLRKLEVLLESYGIKAKKDLINRHIKNCMGSEVLGQRLSEKELLKEKREGFTGKLRRFFNRPLPVPIPKCEHLVTENFFDMYKEVVRTRCKDCGKVLSGSIDPNSKSKRNTTYRDYKSQIILEALST